MNLIRTALLLVLLLTLAWAWYPEYSVMVTDYVLPVDYLAPANIQSIGLQTLGSQFGKIYESPVDNAFQNPAYLGTMVQNYIYFDVAGGEPEYDRYEPMTAYGGYLDYYSLPYYTSPYRSTDPPSKEEPIMRFIFFGKPSDKLPLQLGLTMEYFFNREEFYQPYWYGGGWRSMDAAGNAYTETLSDPYDDYRIVESGENLQDEKGYRISTFASLPVMPALTLGARLTLVNKDIDGNYNDTNIYDDVYWTDDYHSYNFVDKTRTQGFNQTDFAVGMLLKPKSNVTWGIMAGHASGDIDRALVEADTSDYYSRYYNHPDTLKSNIYNSTSGYSSEKIWKYDGNTNYGEVHSDVRINDDVNLRWSAYFESRRADLVESENMWRRSYHNSQYWNSWENELHFYENKSRATLERSGSGEYKHDNMRLSIGANWRMSPIMTFTGGVVLDHFSDDRSASEPFYGTKYSYYSDSWSHHYTTETSQADDKKFSWWREEVNATIAVPTGVMLNLGDAVELSLGLTKYINTTDIDEGYDLVVYSQSSEQVIDGTVISDDDSSYVEGHKFPGIHTFTDEYRMNAGISFKYKDVFKVTAALRESIFEPRSFKIGAEFRW